MTPDPPFYRAEVGHAQADWCDYLLPDADEACDATPKYEIRWLPVAALDLDTFPVSMACEQHALKVDRALVQQMRTLAVVSS